MDISLRGVDRWMMEVDDMTSVVIQQPPIDSSQMVVFAKKVQTIIRRCMVYIGGTLGCTPLQHDIQQTFPVQPSRRSPREHVPERGARGVKRGARRQPGRGAGGGRPPVLPFPHKHEHVHPRHIEVERSEGSGGGQPTVDPFDSPNLDIPSFSLGLTPASQSLPGGSGTSQTPPPPTLISQASSSDEEEQADHMDGVQHYKFGHRVSKKTTRFTPSDWP
ncbi:hypothetical protein M9H77_25365 [Catharanthus roseus]|uniref:Uncharacterized protein n=1 Tax=Catharanthus roseus TaxID=4058 RepID=A0ACC0A7Y8_CATRO|nr:hypothetical protein M9H77_25365 [Catharanthus roseus]